jgi:hypothetical protein
MKRYINISTKLDEKDLGYSAGYPDRALQQDPKNIFI